MNYKSYLKGIGVGIIVTSLILMISGKMNKNISDEDAIKRAKELGYVQNVSVSATVPEDDKTQTAEAETESGSDDVVNTEDNNTDNSDNEINSSVSDNESDVDSVDTTDDTGDAENTETDTDTSNVENITDDQPENDNKTSETVKVEVRSGMSSESVALAVMNAGLVEDDKEFNKYLCENGYDKRLRVGFFDISKGSDFETISKALCGIQ